MISTAPQPQTAPSAPAPASEPLTFRQAALAVAGGLALIVLIAWLIRHTELVTGQYVSTGVPPLPAFGVLVVLSVSRPLLRRAAPRLAPSRAQILLIYAMLTVSVVLSGLYHVRGFLPELVALQYWGRPDSPLARHLAGYAGYLPSWYAPHDLAAIKRYYEGGLDRSLPWNVWLLPLACWSLFFLAMFLGVFSFVTLVQRQWTRSERLSFPLLTLPLAMTSEDWSAYGSLHSRRALFLMGFGVAALFDGINILHTFSPSIPSLGFQISFSGLFPDRPWTPLQSVRLYLMLETIGLGYFVPLDLSFSIWFFYVLNRAFAVAGTAAGNDEPGFPFTQEQSAGGYLAVALFLVWGLRRTLGRSLRSAFGRGPRDAEAVRERWAWIGLLGSVLFILGFCRAAGFSLWLAVPFFGVLAMFTLVYARIRAETGVPFQFIYPWGLPKEMVLNAFSVPQALSWGGTGSFVLFSSFAWLSNNHPPMEQAAYQLDSVKLSQEARIPYKTLFIALLLAFIVGLWAAYWAHLSAYYAQGSNLIPSAGQIGEAREVQARQDYELMASQLSSPPHQNLSRLFAMFGGFCFAGALAAIRQKWVGSPFHPLGFLVATGFGDISTSWFPMLVAWAAKGTILKLGGLPLYRRGMPFFLGLAIGHLLIGGLLWPCIGLFISKEAANAYHLLFGE